LHLNEKGEPFGAKRLTRYLFWKYRTWNSQPDLRFCRCTTAPEAKTFFCILAPPKKIKPKTHTQKKKKTKSEKKKTVTIGKTARARLKGEKKRRYSWWFFLSFWTEHGVLLFPVFLFAFYFCLFIVHAIERSPLCGMSLLAKWDYQ